MDSTRDTTLNVRDLNINSLYDIAGRWIAVTGAASGIGRQLAHGFTVNGANVILIDRNESGLKKVESELEQLRRESASSTTTTLMVVGDLSTKTGIQSIASKITDHGTLDSIVHSAGIRVLNKTVYWPERDDLAALKTATLSAPYEEWELTFRINVMAPYYLTAELIELLGAAAYKGQGRGSVVILSSPASVHTNQFVPCYQTSKAAVDHLVRVMAAEFAHFYIRVNAFSPGLVPSGMSVNEPNANINILHKMPIKRIAHADEMCACVIFLLSRAGMLLDGRHVRADGGFLLKFPQGLTGPE